VKTKQTRAVRIHYHFYFVSVLHCNCIIDKLDEHGHELLEVNCEAKLLLQVEEEPLIAPVEKNNDV
jgi:hypothetical protein